MKTVVKNIHFEREDIEKIEEAKKIYSLSTSSFIRFCVMSKLNELNLQDS